MRPLIIATGIAGSGQATARLAGLLERFPAEQRLATRPGEAAAIAAQAVGRYDPLLAAGGDGTVHEVLNGLYAAGAPGATLGILPLGTGNDIARNLGILSPEDTFAALEAGASRSVDVIRIRPGDHSQPTHYGLLNCGLGFGAEVVRRTTPLVKRLWGKQAYTVGTLRALAGWPSPPMTVRHDGGVFEGRVLFLAAGNGEWEAGGTMRLSPGARMDDGLLHITLIRHGSKLEVLRNFTKIATGAHIHHHLVDYFPTTHLTVESPRPFRVQSDGDVIGEGPCRVDLLPGALAVVAP
ncbi:MAG: diacylglycerol kinase family lipid kinase [Fimbriimonadaceae bacterium]|nr:diacylglycerol kinase family lipid kinase [Fimbriimonadaceae bacterium]